MPRPRDGAPTPSGAPATPGDSNVVDLLSSPVRAAARTRRFATGEIIVQEAEPGSSAYILLSGRCDVTVHGDILNVVGPGEFFGEIACLEGGTRTATVRAAADCDVLELDGAALRAELGRSPALLERFLRVIAQRVRDISRRETTVRDEQRELRRVLESLHPSLDGFRNHASLAVEVRWQPLSFASGDYYDVLELAPTRFLFAVGDVMGHGAPTTPIVSMIRSQIHESATADSRTHELLAHLHRHMQRHSHPDVFMTLMLLLLDVGSSTAEFAVAGPPSPLLCRGGRSSCLTADFGWTLGYPFGGVPFHSENLALVSGDVLLFYTDGLSDAAQGPDPERDWLGVDGLGTILADVCAARADRIADGVFEAVDAFRGGWPAEDDATALVVTLR
jgi:serine phosphatase RsbU (regulator of sigma subunit)